MRFCYRVSSNDNITYANFITLCPVYLFTFCLFEYINTKENLVTSTMMIQVE